MTRSLSRRSFFKAGAALGSSLAMNTMPVRWMQNLVYANSRPDMAAVKGQDYYTSTIKAVEVLGGMGRFASPQSRVGLLVNSPWSHPGSSVRPDISLAVVRMCLEAGAKEVGVFKALGRSYWRRSALSGNFQDEVSSIKYLGGDFTEVPIKGGRSLKTVEIARGLLECDVLINISIAKDHTGTGFSGVMKNMMGATSGSTNRFFHKGSGGIGYYGDIQFLSQCIADLNLVREPDLCILDGTEVLKTNGPAGPGKLVRPQKVIAGIDRVAMDAYGAGLIEVDAGQIRMIQMAREHGLGETDLKQLKIQEDSIEG